MVDTIQGVIRKCINNTQTQFDKLGYVANNFANYSTRGYKGQRFEQMLNEDGYLTGVVRTSLKQGSVEITSNPYDIALTGPGFIPVTSPDGEVQYTRDGSMKIGKNGYLVSNDGWIIGEGIKIPNEVYKISIEKDGTVNAMADKFSKPQKIGKIPVVQFANPEGLVQGAENKLKATEESGDAKLLKNHNYIAQNALECSNVNVVDEVNGMLRLNASMIASLRMAKIMDDMYNKSINIREG